MKKQNTNHIRKVGYVFCNTQGGSVYDSEYISATISACTHGWGQGYIVVEEEYEQSNKSVCTTKSKSS